MLLQPPDAFMTLPSHLTLLGFSPVFRPLAAWASARGVGCTCFAAADQAGEHKAAGWSDVHIVEKLDAALAKRHPDAFSPTALPISFGARWIFKRQHLDGLFHGRLLNAHCSRLPIDRGGGGLSWRIMRGDRIGNLILHRVDEGIDTGAILASEDYVIPAAFRTPAAIQADMEARIPDFVARAIESGAAMAEAPLGQHMTLASYYPRLNTAAHGWIDWTWSPEEIERFILAFDAPHPGARTTWRGQTVILRQAQAHFGEAPHHPFQAGLVFRNNGRWLMVALRGAGALIVEDARDEAGESLLAEIKEGDRLCTPSEMLDAAAGQRVFYGPSGLRPPT
jgi:methionyl-tRNA formyltransferase